MKIFKFILLFSLCACLLWVLGRQVLPSPPTSVSHGTNSLVGQASCTQEPVSSKNEQTHLLKKIGVASPEMLAPIPLISSGEKTDIHWTSRTPAAKRVRRIFPDLGKLPDDPVLKVGDFIQLALFEDVVFDAKISNVTRYLNGAVGMTAHLQGEQGGTVYLSYCDSQMRVSVEVLGGDDYYVRYNPETDEHLAIEVDREKSVILEGGESLVPHSALDSKTLVGPASCIQEPVESKWGDTRSRIREACPTSRSSQVEDSPPFAFADAPDGTTQIDVMVVYTPAALAYEGNLANMNSNIAGAMQKGNEAHGNSDTQITLNLVHSAEIAYTESGNGNTDLNRLTSTSDGPMDEVHDWRDTFGADFVCLFMDTDDFGGLGWLMESDSGDPSHAFCLARVQQSEWTYTVVHEWGHNMGCSHSKTQVIQKWDSGDFKPYSAGWQWLDTKPSSPKIGYCSVMTYEDHDNDGTREYDRVPHFSNPSINYTGNSSNPTGHSSNGDNARTMREMKAVYAAYRASPATIVMNETNIVLTAVSGGTDTVSRVISNAGSGELTFSLSDDNVAGAYSWRDSDDVGGPTYEWIDISASGTEVPLADDGESSMLDIGFSFPFYGSLYSQFQLAGNGVVSLSADEVSNEHGELPDIGSPSQSFCLFWDDLDPEAAGSISYETQSNRLVVSYIGVPICGTSDLLTFQLILSSDGRILYQYNTMEGDLDECTVGIMDDNSSGPSVQVVYDAVYLKDSLAVEFSPPQPRWVGYSLTNGIVTAGGSTSIEVAGNAVVLSEGDYYATLTVTHNDVSRSAIEIPVEFHVTVASDGDLDDDGLPDEWETLYFGGPTNANPNVTASNGINTVWETYVAGLDPTSPTNFFLSSVICPPSSDPVLRWHSISARVYSVWFTTNLLNAFQPLETNILFPHSSYTDEVDSVRFYKIDVELE